MFPTVIQMHDDELRRRVIDYLVACGMAWCQHLDVKVTGGVVVLRGQVESDHQRQLSLRCCCRVAGVLRVVDQLNVTRATSGYKPTRKDAGV